MIHNAMYSNIRWEEGQVLVREGDAYVLCNEKKDSGLCKAADAAKGDCTHYDRRRHGGDPDEQAEFLLSFSRYL